MTDHLTIGEFARRTGLSLKALRLYDESGLLVPAAVDEVTGYRYYSPAQETAARRISLLRRLDMPLARIAALLATPDTTAATEALLGWWAEQEQAVAQRRGTVEYLVTEWRDEPAETFAVEHRHVPDRLVATITSNVLQAELVPTLTASVTRIRDHLREEGATFGDEWWAIYHGVVSPDSDGPVEVCVPYAGHVTPSGRIVARVEQAHAHAYTPITSAQCRYPRILHAYDAVTRWVRRHGSPTAPTREIYPVPWHTDPEAHVADIAQPYREDRP